MEEWLGREYRRRARAARSAATCLAGRWRSTASSFEAIPQDLIVKAALMAAAGIIEASRSDAGPAPLLRKRLQQACH